MVSEGYSFAVCILPTMPHFTAFLSGPTLFAKVWVQGLPVYKRLNTDILFFFFYCLFMDFSMMLCLVYV